MNFKILVPIVILNVFLSTANAACGDESFRTINGDEAISLTYVLKNSNIARKTVSGVTATWSLARLVCRQTNRGVLPDLMPAYNCTVPAGIGPIAAKALFDAMSELSVYPEGTTGHVNEQAKSIQCKVNTNGSGGDAINPRCRFKAAWGDECG
jgi:hypothetical protein